MFICLECKKKYKKSDLTTETYGNNFSLERYCCPNCDGTCLELEDCYTVKITKECFGSPLIINNAKKD